MRVINFEGDNEQHSEAFDILYQGFLMGTPEGGLKGITSYRKALAILNKFEAISKPAMRTVTTEEGEKEVPVRIQSTGDEVRELLEEGGTLELEEAEYEMVKAHFDTVPFRVGIAKTVVFVADLLENSEED